MLLRISGNCFTEIVYGGDGSEAVESALKVALQHFAARGLMNKRRFIARDRSWHGDTLGALSISGFAARRRAFEGSLLEVAFVSAANAYRLPDGCSPASLAGYLAAELEQTILARGTGNGGGVRLRTHRGSRRRRGAGASRICGRRSKRCAANTMCC